MSRHVLPLLAILVTGMPVHAEITIPGRLCGNVQYITITDAALARSPAWTAEAANPPVSAREAMRLAGAQKARILHDTKDCCYWQFESIMLVAAGESKWFWMVEYQEHCCPGVGLQGVPGVCRFVILMDGTVLVPKAPAPGSK
jgi:hypothetical protein